MGRTGKPLDVIVDESLFDTTEIQGLVEKGHTVKRLMSAGYDVILGAKAWNFTLDDLKKNPKLLEIALKRATTRKYPKEAKDGVDDKKAQASTSAEVKAQEPSVVQPAPTKRKRRTKAEMLAARGAAGTQQTFYSTTDPGTDPASGGK